MRVTDCNFNPSADDGITAVKKAALAFQDAIEAHAPEGRRRSIALTHVEAASMFAVKSIAVGDE